MILKHEHSQWIVALSLMTLAAVECVFYGVPTLLAAPSLAINLIWVWE